MWGYQEHFRLSVQYVAREVLKALGVSVDVTALLVGARRPDRENRNDVCVEPEDGQWPLALFDGLFASVEDVYSKHEAHGVFYGDEPSNRDKPEWMRRDSVTTAVGSWSHWCRSVDPCLHRGARGRSNAGGPAHTAALSHALLANQGLR